MNIRGIKMRIKYIIPLVVLICLLTVIIPTASVEGASVKADFTITASKIIRPDTHKYEWEAYSNEVLSFDASDSTSAKNFTWDFGDGTTNTTTSKFTSHTYSSTGKFQIKLTVSDGDKNSDTIYGNITVVEKPLAVLVVKDAKTDAPLAADYNVNVGQAVLFDASGSRGDIKSYYFGYNLRGAFIPQASKNDPTYTYTYTTKGDYRVGLRVVDRLGNKSETPKDQFITIHVNAKSSGGGTSYNLPISLPILLGGVGIVAILAIVGVLYHMGYIGPFMIGGGSTKKKEEEESKSGTVGSSELDSILKSISFPEKEKPSLPDLPKLGGESSLSSTGTNMDEEEKEEEEKTVYEVKTCPKCGGKIPITSLERPLKVKCPSCGASFTLKAKPGAKKGAAVKPHTHTHTVAHTHKAMPAEDTEIVICPSCGKALPVPAGATSVKCDACGTVFDI